MRHVRRARCGSTNDEARALLGQGAQLPFLVSAAEQTAGRGREGRAWSHQPGNLAVSYVLSSPPALGSEPGLVSLLAGLAAARTMEAFGAREEAVALKWPNDVLLGGRKVAGILSELITHGGGPVFILGIGVNLVAAPTDTRFPAGAAFPPRQAPSDQLFAERLGEELLRFFAEAGEGGGAKMLDAFRKRAWRLGESVTVRTNDVPLRGVFEDIDRHGRMILRLPGGELRTISAGDTGSG